MVEHIVLFKWQPEATEAAIADVLTALRGMVGKIPSIVALSCGENFSARSQGFTHGLVVRFRDRQGLADYQPHPLHQDIIATKIKPILAETLAVDYEF